MATEASAEAGETYKAELVFGIVCPLGTQYQRTIEVLESSLTRFGYATHIIHISHRFPDLLHKLGLPIPEKLGVGEKIKAGDDIRARTCTEILAGYAIEAIRERRGEWKPLEKTAYVVLQLKRPEEVELLRKTYGQGFFLIGISASQAERMHFFRDHNISDSAALGWAAADSDERSDCGQLISKTFHLADVFVASGECEQQIPRFLDLAFSSPFITPTREERGMFLAYASAMSSGDLSRQVGATLVSHDGDVIAVGYNEVPKAGGGRYEGGTNSYRDTELGEDANHRERSRIAQQILARYDPGGRIGASGLREAGVFSITEYGRAVHAEMDAILSCARSGRSAAGATLYVTTFPCHNCARHILASGIARVLYVEPYPQSKAGELHADAIELDGVRHGSTAGGRIPFEPFIGGGPRRYIDLFSLKLGSGIQLEREKDGKKRQWRPDLAGPRLAMLPSSYLEREQGAAEDFATKMRRGAKPR